MTEVKGIDREPLSAWLAQALPGHPPPYHFELVAAGGSNLTYIVSDAGGGAFVLRRPPVRARIATAHDMQREYRIMGALAGSGVPVPKMLAWCDDPAVNGAEFYCMEKVDGHILRDLAATGSMSVAACERASGSLIEGQVCLHQVDLEAVGLADLARHEHYLERQLKRWATQVEKGRTRDLPLLERLHRVLAASVPEPQTAPALVHGDYRFDNVVLDSGWNLSAVLDWELCTIGDPVADFVWSLCYWAEPEDSLTWLMDPPTRNPNFPRRQAVLEAYQARSGLTLRHLDWYLAFSWWKQACIVEGVYARLQKGAGGGMKVESLERIAARVERYLQQADSILQAA